MSRLLLGLLSMLCLSAADAAEWRGEGIADFSAQYNDNWLLNDTDRLESAAARADLAGDVIRESDRNRIGMQGSATFQTFEDERLENLLDWYGGVDARRYYARGLFFLDASYQKESSLLGGFQQDGRIGLDEQRYIATAGFGNLHEFGERNRLQSQAQVVSVEYDVAESGIPRSDYDLASLSMSWDSEFSERTTLAFQLLADYFDSTTDLNDFIGFLPVSYSIRNETLLVGPGVEVNHEFTESFRLSSGINYRRVRFDLSYSGDLQLPSSRLTDNQTFGFVSLVKTFARQYVELEWSKGIQPSANGVLAKRERGTVRWRVELGERSRFGAEAHYLLDRFTGGLNDRDAIDATIQWSRDIGERTELSVHYRYRYQDQQRSSVDASGNHVGVSFAYRLGA